MLPQTVSNPESPVVASHVATFLKPEMLHVFRQITALQRWRPVVVTQKRELSERFPFADVVICRKPLSRTLRALWQKRVLRGPVMAYRSEARAFDAASARVHAKLVHIYFGHMGVYWLPWLRDRRLPVVVSFHGADAGMHAHQPRHRTAMREMLGLADLVLVRSDSLAWAVTQQGANPAKVRIHRTGLPLDDFAVIPRIPPEHGDWHFVQACRLIPKKGLATTVRAFAAFAARHPMARLTIAGEGPMRHELEQLVRELGAGARVAFTGFLSQTEMRDLFAQAHVFLHPSETASDGNAEGVPNAMLEAMATGLPVVATRHGGIPEAVDDGASGILVGERDATALAEALQRLAADPGLWSALGEGAARAVRARFDLIPQTRELERFYDEACARRG